jgi:CBS domain containing-hemolysin-like protein
MSLPLAISSLLLFIALIVLSACFSGTETALLSFRHHRLRFYRRRHPRQAEALKAILKQPHDFISTILICNNFVNVAASSLSTYLCVLVFGDQGVLVSTFAVTAILLVFAEITPKTYAASHADAISLRVSPSLRALIMLFRPLNRLLTLLGKGFKTPVPDRQLRDALFAEEIKSFVHSGLKHGILDARESFLIQNILDFEKATVRSIMVPRQEVIMLPVAAPMDAVRRQVATSGFSRYPVYQRHREDVIGMVHIKDIFLGSGSRQFTLRQAVKPIHFVPEFMPLDGLWDTFIEKRIEMAMVVDEYGGIEGLVTFSDLAEEIFGEISRELDRSPANDEIVALRDGSYLVRADVSIRRLNHDIPFFDLEDENGYTNLAGYILAVLGRIPTVGTELDINGARLRVTRVKANKVTRVMISPRPPKNPSPRDNHRN